ncbi:ABC transporter ATP-binding protein [Bradyrhizobium liaoningense]
MILTVRKLKAGYGPMQVLSGISLDVNAGEAVGILGHNGMGKTTLLRTLMGHLTVQDGSIHLGGKDVTQEPAERRAAAGMTLVPQGRGIFSGLSVFENLRFALVGSGRPESVLDEVVASFPRLRRLFDRAAGALSGGEQQLLALARALCIGPSLLLLDEPTEGIQPSICDEIVDILGQLRRTSKLSLIVVEQNLEFLRALADRVLVMQKGAFVGELSPGLLADPVESMAALDIVFGAEGEQRP